MTINIVSGHAAIDRYLANGYATVKGMSSRFAAAICGHVIRRQSELGISGDMVEIGTFEGRFFIAMALGLTDHEQALGIDRFDWPDDRVRARLLDNCAAMGLAPERIEAWQEDSRNLAPAELRKRLNGHGARFIHVDGDHTPESLAHDLELAHAVLNERGVIALDDMLHPGYPTLVVTVVEYLTRHPEMRVVCIIDREDISAAAKFLICRTDVADVYERDLMQSFAQFHFEPGARMMGHVMLVLTPEPRLAEI
jgi:predicted O-methyltransferase YrrM